MARILSKKYSKYVKAIILSIGITSLLILITILIMIGIIRFPSITAIIVLALIIGVIYDMVLDKL